MRSSLHIVVLAAGEGRRMQSRRPKVLAPLGGRPMLAHLLDTVFALNPERVHVVVGAGAEQVRAAFAGHDVSWVEQTQRLGTGHALAQALPDIPAESKVLVLPGDMPLIETDVLQDLLRLDTALSLLTFMAAEPTGYGRILRDRHDRLIGIREERDASDEEKRIREVNSSVMLAACADFKRWVTAIEPHNAQGEYYLTDCVFQAVAAGQRVDAIRVHDPQQLLGANDRQQLAELEHSYQTRARRRLLQAGAILIDPDSVFIRGRVSTGQDVSIDTGVMLAGHNRLGNEVHIGVGCILTDCTLADGTSVQPYSVLEGVQTTGACTIGPFARLRPGTILATNCRVGNFVEVKNARLESGVKINHLSYVGDASVGAGANIGAGTITCNYDGANKHQTEIGAGAFIGSNVALVAPVCIGDHATIGAGSVISADAPAGQLTLARARQKTVEGWERPVKNSG